MSSVWTHKCYTSVEDYLSLFLYCPATPACPILVKKDYFVHFVSSGMTLFGGWGWGGNQLNQFSLKVKTKSKIRFM